MLFPFGFKSGAFIDAPLTYVERCLIHWATGNPAERDIRRHCQKTSLADAASFLKPRFFTPDRAVLISHASGWTAFFDNQSNHFEPQAELLVLCERLKTRTCFFMYESEDDQTRSAVFRHYRYCESEGAVDRMLWLGKEDKWKFSASGVPLAFEHVEAYTAPCVRDRLTQDILKHYGESLGISFFEADSYRDQVAFLGWRSMIPGQRPHGCDH